MEIPAWLNDFEERLRAEFTPLRNELNAMNIGIRASVSSNTWGTLTGANGYAIHLSCMFDDRKPREPDEVSLSVCFQHVDTEPEFEADVCWGQPSLYVEDGFSEHRIPFSQAAHERLFFRLPQLFSSLRAAALRGYPSDEAE